jgi:hypothetical protein
MEVHAGASRQRLTTILLAESYLMSESVDGSAAV